MEALLTSLLPTNGSEWAFVALTLFLTYKIVRAEWSSTVKRTNAEARALSDEIKELRRQIDELKDRDLERAARENELLNSIQVLRQHIQLLIRVTPIEVRELHPDLFRLLDDN